MNKVLKVNSVNDYARYIGAEELHPEISIIHYDELKHCRHSLNNYGVYGLFMMKEVPDALAYGRGMYQAGNLSLICVAPGQVGGIADTGHEIQLSGWALLFSPQLLAGTELGKTIENYAFFSYHQNEALRILPKEWQTMETLFGMLQNELRDNEETFRQQAILVTHIKLILEYCACFHERQFRQSDTGKELYKDDILKRFNQLLNQYYKQNLQRKFGVPTVRYCANELFLSPNYFGDLIRKLTGETAIHAIQKFIMLRAQDMLIEGKTVSETATNLGFDYPQHFSRQFKMYFGVSPKQFLQRQKASLMQQ